MLVTVGDETDGGTNAIALIVEQGRRLEDVEVVVRPGDSKISMPYPQPVVSYSFKDHRGMLGFEYPLPGGGAVPPLPMHTIDAAQHPREFVHRPMHINQQLAVFRARTPK